MNSKAVTYQRYGNFIINKSAALGSGNFGSVWRGYLIGPNNSLQPVAIKQSYNEMQNIKQIETLQVLKHPNIVRYRDYRISGNQVFMVMELCEGGTLDDLLYSTRTHDTATIVGYFSQIVSGIRFMYENNILHRDIKPSNLLVTKNNIIKIADFGSSKMYKSTQLMLKTLVGTPLFFSPELLKMSLGEEDTYTEKSEIWALGLILYYMFNYEYNVEKSGQRIKKSLPWTGKNTLQILKNIKNMPLKFKKEEQIPVQLQQIIRKMLKVNAEERMSFKQLFEIEIFKKVDYESSCLQIPDNLEQKTINEIKRQTIDWELWELLEKENQLVSDQEEIEQVRQFYQLLIAELSEILQPQYQELLFQLQLKYYELTDKNEEKCKIKQKYGQRANRFKQIQQNKINDERNLKQNQNPFTACNNVTYLTNINEIDNEYSDKAVITIPNEKLLIQSKLYIKDNIQKILDTKAVSTDSQKIKNEINFLYDLFILATFEKSWDIKKKTNSSMENYKNMRKLVKMDSILYRIRKASQAIKL